MGAQLENSKTNGQGRKHNCCDQQLFKDTEGLKGAKDSAVKEKGGGKDRRRRTWMGSAGSPGRGGQEVVGG